MKLSVIKFDGAIYPVGEHSQSEASHLVAGKEYIATITMHRNPKFHRLAFSLLNMIYDNQDGFKNRDLFRSWITMKAGYVITGVAPNGTTIFMPESLSFEKMPQDKFEKWYSSVIDVAIAEYGMDSNTLNQILNYA